MPSLSVFRSLSWSIPSAAWPISPRVELRTPMAPEVAFSEDPLRMLRLHRFVATLGFHPRPGRRGGGGEHGRAAQIVSAERIRDEFSRLITAPYPETALWGVVRSGLAAHFLPELLDLEMEQDPVQRHKDVLAHSIAVTVCTSPDLVLRLAALLHDIGKPATRQFGKEGSASTTTRWSGRGWPGRGSGRCASPARSSTMSGTWCSSICAPTPTRWDGPMPRCVATCVMPATSSSRSTSW